MENTMDIFHLGIVNGGAGSGCFYGYFSDYNKLNVQAVVAGTSYSQLRLCYGDSAQLFAWGGTDYLWWPDSTLSDPTSQMPMASPHVTTKYYVEVSGACDMKDTATIDVLVSTPLGATFTTDRVEGCAPFTVTFTDHSFGISSWRYDFGDGSPYARYDYDISTPYPEPPSPFVFTHTFTNTTDSIITYKVVLLARMPMAVRWFTRSTSRCTPASAPASPPSPLRAASRKRLPLPTARRATPPTFTCGSTAMGSTRSPLTQPVC